MVNEDDKKINVHATILMLTSYATRPAKKDTIFDNIKRLGISEKIQIKKAKIKIIIDIKNAIGKNFGAIPNIFKIE